MSRTPRRTTAIALAASMLTLALAGQAFANTQDLRSPDARDAARLSQLATPTTTYQDLRSPDARDAASVSEQGQYQDLRSPDARDAGRVVPQAPVASASPSSDGFNWGYLAIGAGALLLLIVAGTLITRSVRVGAKASVPTS